MNKIVIIGAGIVGLATALKLLEKNPKLKVTVIEKEGGPAEHQTGNNSGVIHAGVYYRPGSLRAVNCRKGYQMLVDFCEKENVKYELCGKLIVATNEEEYSRLDGLLDTAKQNGLEKVTKIAAEEILKYEPYATGLGALHVPYTGIIDYREVAEKYAELITNRLGGEVLLGHTVKAILKKSGGVEVVTNLSTLQADFIINTAGLYSDKIALMTEDNLDVRIIPFRGEYKELKEGSKHLVNNLIYPVPDPRFPFLGVHFTRMIHGGVEAGPNAVLSFKQEGYKRGSFNGSDFMHSMSWPGFRKVITKFWQKGMGEYWRSFNNAAFVKALSKLVPEITTNDVVQGGAGVRAMAVDRNGNLSDDFMIKENQWAINVLNAPSPAATASLSIGDSISELALKRIK